MAYRPVLKVARGGEDLQTCPIYKMTINSLKNHLKVHTTEGNELLEKLGTITIPESTGAYRYYLVIEHNLGYRPFLEAYVRDEGATKWTAVGGMLPAHEDMVATIQGINETVITFYQWDLFAGTIPEHDIEYKYLIYIDPSKDGWDS